MLTVLVRNKIGMSFLPLLQDTLFDQRGLINVLILIVVVLSSYQLRILHYKAIYPSSLRGST